MSETRDAIDPAGLWDGYTPAKRYTPPVPDQRLSGNLKEWFQSAYQYRLIYERQWTLNKLFLKGEQLVGKHRITGDIIRLSVEDSRRLRSQNNMLRPTSRSLVGKLAKLIPTYTCTPATADFEEVQGSRAADLILQYLRSQLDLDRTYHEMCGYLPWAGNAFLQLCWEPLAGRTIAWCQQCNFFSYEESLIDGPCPNCKAQRDEALIAQKQQQLAAMDAGQTPPSPPGSPGAQGYPPPVAVPPMVEAREGDVSARVRDPRDVFFPPGASDIRTVRRFCVREAMEVAEARRRYPLLAQIIKPDAGFDMAATATIHRYGSPEATNSIDDLKDHVYVYEFHEADTETYPDGRVIVMINDNVVEEKPGYFRKFGRLPIFQFGFDINESELYREPFITQAWHRQRELNRLETQLREHVEQVLRPKLMNPIGSRIANEEFSADSDQVINYNPAAGAPEWIRPPEIPQGLWNRKQDLMQDMRMSASITESEQGIQGSDPNGRAMAIINAEADQQVGPIVAANNSEWKEFHRCALILYRCYAHPDRIASVAGKQGVQIVSFKDLNLLNPGWDLKMEQEDGLSRNPAVRLTQAMDLANIGFFNNSQTGMFDRKAFARYAKLGTPDQGTDTEATERAAASSIPYMVMQGIPWAPHMYDDPAIFEDELRGWLRGPGRKLDPMISQQVEQIWMYYAQWALTGQMNPMMGQAQGQPGMAPQGAGSDMTAPGGTPNNPGHLGTNMAGGQPGVAQEASMQVKGADRQGDQQARVQMNHES